MGETGSKRNTFQYKHTVSLNRDAFLEVVVRNGELSKKDLRVCMHLMTHLDSMNFKEISKKQIADDLNLAKSDVSKAINNLIDEGVIVMGSSQSVKQGYKLLF